MKKLSDIGDVIITTPAEGQTLKYINGNWVNETVEASTPGIYFNDDLPAVEDRKQNMVFFDIL